MPAADAEGRGMCERKKIEGEVFLFRWDVKWRAGVAMAMEVSLALFLSRGVCVPAALDPVQLG